MSKLTYVLLNYWDIIKSFDQKYIRKGGAEWNNKSDELKWSKRQWDQNHRNEKCHSFNNKDFLIPWATFWLWNCQVSKFWFINKYLSWMFVDRLRISEYVFINRVSKKWYHSSNWWIIFSCIKSPWKGTCDHHEKDKQNWTKQWMNIEFKLHSKLFA